MQSKSLFYSRHRRRSSNFTVSTPLDYAVTNNLTPFITLQNHYSLLYRQEEREMMPTLKVLTLSSPLHFLRSSRFEHLFPHLSLGSIPWNVLARGMLTLLRLFWLSLPPSGGGVEIINRVEEIATKKHASMAQIALGVLHTPDVTAPLVDTTSLEKLHDFIDALEIVLGPEEGVPRGSLHGEGGFVPNGHWPYTHPGPSNIP
ncbi:hypothetical protein OF83DRAFT_1178411 [Amylostereum chailletii]|nr:hypothetical protein OF83DRAFT_1178411 [Amylostereum chailletii]